MNLLLKLGILVTVTILWESVSISFYHCTSEGDYGCCSNEDEDCDCTVTTTVTFSQVTSNVTNTEVTDSQGNTKTYTTTVNVTKSATDSTTSNDQIVVGNDTSNDTSVATTTAAPSTTGTTTTSAPATYGTCKELYDGGSTTTQVYNITLGGSEVEVYCVQDVDSGGWTVIQRRTSGSVDFYLEWDDYRDGFGSKSGEHWLGLETIYDILQTGTFELRIDLGNSLNQTRYAKYQDFNISAESSQYALNSIGGYSGDAGDSLSSHLNANFTTRDQDNDQMSAYNCAQLYTGAWWYKQCYDSNLNGEYGATEGRGVVWNTWHTGSLISSTTMAIRER